MAKITVLENPYNVKFPDQKDDLLKIWEDEKEPPKGYLWKVDGYLYVLYKEKWIYINKYIEMSKLINRASKQSKVPESSLEELKAILLDKISKYVNKNGSIPEWLEERIINLENKEDRDTIYDDSYIRQLIHELDAENDDFIIAEDSDSVEQGVGNLGDLIDTTKPSTNYNQGEHQSAHQSEQNTSGSSQAPASRQ